MAGIDLSCNTLGTCTAAMAAVQGLSPALSYTNNQ